MNIREMPLKRLIKNWANYDEIMAILESLPFGCNLWNNNLKLINCNKQMVDLLGVPSKSWYLDNQRLLMPHYQKSGMPSAEEMKRKVWEAFDLGRLDFNWTYLDGKSREVTVKITLDRVRINGETHVVAYVFDAREVLEYVQKIKEAESRNRILFDEAPLSCSLWSQSYEIVACNQAALKLFGVPSKQEYYKRIRELSPEYQPNGTNSVMRIKEALIETFKTGRMEFEWVHQSLSGEEIPSMLTLIRVIDNGEYYVAAYVQDLRAQKASLRKMAEAAEFTKLMIDSSPLACGLWNGEGLIIDCNEEAVKLFGLSDKKEYLERYASLSPEYQPDGALSIKKYKQIFRQALQSDERLNIEWMHQNMAGELIPAEITLKRFVWQNGYVVVSHTRDLRQMKKTVDIMNTLEQLAYMDGLTNVHNRRYFTDTVKRYLSSTTNSQEKICLIMFDLDNFKSINDDFGHAAGDFVLGEIVNVVNKVLRADDLFARYGGDEFLLMIKNADRDQAYYLAERIRRAVQEHDFSYEGQIIKVTVSVGVMLGRLPITLDNACKIADEALYDAKNLGKNTVSLREI